LPNLFLDSAYVHSLISGEDQRDVQYLIDRNLTGVQDSVNITAHALSLSHSLSYDTFGATQITCEERDDAGRRIAVNFP
jgi:hypothetical protein